MKNRTVGESTGMTRRDMLIGAGTLAASALAGGALLVIADTLARTVMAPRQLPVGALTAAIGVPLFLILMSRIRAERYR